MINAKALLQKIESGDVSYEDKLAALSQVETALKEMRDRKETVLNDRVGLIITALKNMQDKVAAQLEEAKAIVPEVGPAGPKGEPGERGLDGSNGRDGRDGVDGRNGVDGVDGISVTDAHIDFDGSLIITLSSGQVINVGEVVTPDLAEKIRVINTMSTNTAIADITGGTIDNTVIGGTTPSAATFTSVTVPGVVGNAVISPNTSITSWLYSGKSFSLIGQESAATGLFIGADGTKMYVNGTTGDDVNEYDLGTAWDVSTATFVTVFSTAAQDTAPADLFFAPDGLTMYVVGDINNTVFQYTLGTAWSVATASYASKSFSVATQETTPSGIWFKPDGTEMYIVGSLTDAAYQYTLSTAWDVSTASYSGKSYSVAAQETAPGQINLSADGTKMWLLGAVGDDIWEYTLNTAWDLSTATPVNNFYLGFQETNPTGMFIDSSVVNRVYMLGSSSDAVYQYNTATNSAEFSTDKLYTPGALSVNGNLVAGANAYVDGALTVQGGASLGTLTVGTTTITGTPTLGTGTGALTCALGTGATASGSLKTINIGIAGLSGSTTNINIGSNVSGSLGTTTISAPTVNIGQTATQLAVTNTASAVNYVQVTGGATNNRPTVSSQGSDTDIGFNIVTKGSGTHNFASDANIATSQFQVTRTQASAVNYLTATGAATNFSPRLFVAGSDTNISQVFQSKGTGAIDLAAGSSGVNISNGTTVTAITRTAAGLGYTSVPTTNISAPTTAGGVQAVISIPSIVLASPALNVGGTGYTVGDVLTLVGGTFTTAATVTVTAVSSGVITAVSISNNGVYTVAPATPISVTGGTGTGAAFNSSFGINSNFTITNAGSGYVEQPTVTFSGGGGSGAAAYATVGSGTTVRSIGSPMDFYSPNAGIGLRVYDAGGTGTGYWRFAAGFAATATQISSSTGGNIATGGAGPLNFQTNNTTTQMAVTHTASAVNYVQVTGSATGGRVSLSAQGSDTNIALNIDGKGTSNIFLRTGGSAQFAVVNTGGAVANYATATGSIAGAAPEFSVAGSDTNIDLALTPKGTGNVRFGAYTGTVSAITGYIEIKDAGGTIRRLAVVA